jgi:hypothetical protein
VCRTHHPKATAVEECASIPRNASAAVVATRSAQGQGARFSRFLELAGDEGESQWQLPGLTRAS